MEQATGPDPATGVLNGIREFAHNQVEEWSQQCARFRQWEKEELLHKEPSEQTLSRHARILKFFLKNTEALIATAADDEVYDDKLRERLSIIHERLIDSGEMFHSTMTDEEANRLLAEVFPDGH
jgi:hypothetical protein